MWYNVYRWKTIAVKEDGDMKKNVIILQANDEEAFECAQNLNENFEISLNYGFFAN